MGNKNNNLEDFLRRKFSDIEDSEEAWTRPSLMVKNSVLDQITAPAQEKRKRALLLFLLLLGIVGSIGFYEYFKERKDVTTVEVYTKELRTDASMLNTDSRNTDFNASVKPIEESNVENKNAGLKFSNEELIERNHLLRAVIQNQNDVITQLKKESLNSNKNTVEQTVTKESLQGKQSEETLRNLLETNSKLKIKQHKLKLLNETQQKEIEQLYYEKQLLLDSLNGQIYASSFKAAADEMSTIEHKIAFQGIQPLVADKLEEERLVEPVKLDENFGLDKPKRKVEFEVGYQLGLRGRMTEVIEYVEGQRTITNQVKEKFLVSHVHGLNIGISPVQNFWIKTGAHLGNMNLHQKHAIQFIYDSNRTSAVTSGAYANDINDLSYTGVNTIQDNIQVLADERGTVDGDELDFRFQTNLVLTSLQIPLEFNYIYGKKKLQALFQLGGQWNLLNYQYYMHGFETNINHQGNIGLADEHSDKPKTSSVQYWGLHAGVGLHYNISKHLALQGLFSYEYYFQDNALNQNTFGSQNLVLPSASYKTNNPIANMNFGFKLGLNYRF